MKNREAAQLFRQRQKAYIQDLEKKVQDLTAINNEYRARVELVNSENKLIKEQLLYLRTFVSQAVFSFPKTPNTPGGVPGPVSGIPPSLASLAGLNGTTPTMLSNITGALPPSLLVPLSSTCTNSTSASTSASIHTIPPHQPIATPQIPATTQMQPQTTQPQVQISSESPSSPALNLEPLHNSPKTTQPSPPQAQVLTAGAPTN